MPGMDGYAVCRALREQALFDDTVIIAQTGCGGDEKTARLLANQDLTAS